MTASDSPRTSLNETSWRAQKVRSSSPRWMIVRRLWRRVFLRVSRRLYRTPRFWTWLAWEGAITLELTLQDLRECGLESFEKDHANEEQEDRSREDDRKRSEIRGPTVVDGVPVRLEDRVHGVQTHCLCDRRVAAAQLRHGVRPVQRG